MGGSNPGLITRLQNWAAHPFTQDMDLLDVTLTVGLVVILALFWITILGDVLSPLETA